MIGMDCINQQTAQDRDCSHCIWHTDGRCASWDCEYISRKEALEALEKVKAMSTHPNTPNTLKALDCISRKDTVDIINGYAEQFNGYIGTPNDSEVYAYARGLLLSIERNINALPSAQPEIIHCRDCKHRGEKPIADGRYWCEIHDTFMYYCSDAERRTDEQT